MGEGLKGLRFMILVRILLHFIYLKQGVLRFGKLEGMGMFWLEGGIVIIA